MAFFVQKSEFMQIVGMHMQAAVSWPLGHDESSKFKV